MAVFDWVVIAFFLTVIIIVGLVVRKTAGANTSNFFVAGRKLPWWLSGLSMAASNFGSDSPLHMSAMTRRSGILGCWFYFRQIPMQIVTSIFFAKLWRRSKIVTDVQFYEIRHGSKGAKILRGFMGVYQGLLISPLRVAVFIVAMQKLCTVLLNIPSTYSLPVLGDINSAWTVAIALTLIALLYSAISGLVGVAWTDFIEFAIAMIGTYVLMFYGIDKVGGLGALQDGVTASFAKSNIDFNPFSIFPGIKDLISIPFIFYMFVWWWIGQIGGGGAWAQRFLASKTEKDAVLCGIWNTMATFVIRFWPWFMIGFTSLILFPDILNHEDAVPYMIHSLLPTGIIGLLFVAFFYAFLSSIDSNYNVGASYILNDVYRRFMVKNKSEKHYMFVSKLATVMIAVVGIMIASQQAGILDTLKLIMKLYAGSGVIRVIRWFWWRVNAWSEIAVHVAGGGSAITFSIIQRAGGTTPAQWLIDTFDLSRYAGHFPFKELYFSVDFMLISVIAVVVAFIVMFITKPEDENVLTNFFRLAKPAGPGWKKIADMCPDVKIEDSLAKDTIAAGIGLIFAFSGMFTMGYLFLGAWLTSGINLIICIVSLILLSRHLKYLNTAVD